MSRHKWQLNPIRIAENPHTTSTFDRCDDAATEERHRKFIEADAREEFE